MNKKNVLSILLLFDVLVGVLFVASNWWIWQYLGGKVTLNSWGPFQISIIPQTIAGESVNTVGTFISLPNYPFIIFWVALAGNFALGLLAVLGKDKHH